MKATQQIEKIHIKSSQWLRAPDSVVVEQALLINLRHRQQTIPLAMTMRTPGDDRHLVAGYLFTEGLIQDAHHIQDTRPIKSCSEQQGSTMAVYLDDQLDLPEKSMLRFGTVSSACGLCGKSSLTDIAEPSLRSSTTLKLTEESLLHGLQSSRAYQNLFAETGASHQACLLDLDGKVLGSAEDVGRHNALDKLIGRFLLENRLPELGQGILFLSGRSSFELVQKAAMAGIQAIVSVGAPSSLAIEKAQLFHITLAGFLKHNSLNIYTGWERLQFEKSPRH